MYKTERKVCSHLSLRRGGFLKEEMYPVFVYGTLKKGFGNHVFLDSMYEKEDEGTIVGELYEVFGGGFPALVDGQDTVFGEVYWVIDEVYYRVMSSLDRLEAEGSMYERKLVRVNTKNNGEVLAWTYFWKIGEFALNKKIVSGVFTKNRR